MSMIQVPWKKAACAAVVASLFLAACGGGGSSAAVATTPGVPQNAAGNRGVVAVSHPWAATCWPRAAMRSMRQPPSSSR